MHYSSVLSVSFFFLMIRRPPRPQRTATLFPYTTLFRSLAHASRVTAMGTLASALAHELNQPLTAIANYLEAGRDMLDAGGPVDRELLREAMAESEIGRAHV